MNGLPTDTAGDLVGVAAVLIALFLFGICYNVLVAWLHTRSDFPASVLVVFGVIVTTMGVGLLDLFVEWNVVLLNLVGFSASGTAMLIGDLWRGTRTSDAHLRRIETYAERASALAATEGNNDDETESLAQESQQA